MKKLYQITFCAALDDDDLRAMNKYFYETMNESMQIEPYGLTIIPAIDEPKVFKHISDVKEAFANRKNKDEVAELLGEIPAKFGTFTVSYDAENDGYYVRNSYQEDDEYFEDEFWVDFPVGWEYDTEEEPR
jgi:hypothetical protein